MNAPYQAFFLNRNIKIKILRDFIMDYDVTDADTIIMFPADFEQIAKEHYQTYKVGLSNHFFLFDRLIREDKEIKRQGSIAVIKNDPDPVREEYKELKKEEEDKIVYRCGYCGNLVGDKGEEIDREEINKDKDYLKRFGGLAKVEKRHGFCCAPGYYEEQAKYPSYLTSFHDIDYSIIEDKELMDLTEDDFKRIGLDKGKTLDFEILYQCQNDHFIKIYFTPNANTYTLRGYLLREEKQIFTTEELIKAIKKWRQNKVLTSY